MIEATYTVQNPHMTAGAVRAVVKGVEMTATVDTFEVELVADDLAHGGIKLRFVGAEVDPAKALFVADAKVKAQFASATAAEPEKK